ncbi:MAG: hypothetical protein KDD45_02680, partial [Bdellovibrionales bacterium]|nr:hypothetical protein [Bdellovibrionales bacterium]
GRLVLVTAHHLCSKAGVKNSSKHLFLPDSANHPNDKPIEIDFDKSFVAGSDGPGKCNNLRLQNPENDWAIAVLKEDIFKKYPHRGYRAMKISDQNPADYSKGDNCRFFAFHIDKEAQQDYSKYMERGCKYNNYKPSYQNYILEYFNSTQRSSGSPGTVCNGRYDERTNECLGEYELMAINVNGNLQARYQCQTTCANGSVVISNNTDVLSKLDEMKRLYP